MSSISVPIAGAVISVSGFGAPVVNALNAITDGTNLVTNGNATIGGNLSVAGIGQLQITRKTASETVNNSAVLQDDDNLLGVVVASGVYEFTLRLNYVSGTTPDLKIGWSVPSGTTMVWSGVDSDTAGAVRITGGLIQTTVPAICGAGTSLQAFYTGIITVSSTAGSVRLQWAQNTANASNSTVDAGSYLKLIRIA